MFICIPVQSLPFEYISYLWYKNTVYYFANKSDLNSEGSGEPIKILSMEVIYII